MMSLLNCERIDFLSCQIRILSQTTYCAFEVQVFMLLFVMGLFSIDHFCFLDLYSHVKMLVIVSAASMINVFPLFLFSLYMLLPLHQFLILLSSSTLCYFFSLGIGVHIHLHDLTKSYPLFSSRSHIWCVDFLLTGFAS